ncbi:type I restriction enzyme, R subunit [Amycolatopsis marina]|uniref:Type I restriction enzyme endonuclease subunit n=1 Tax=Amycolatopsis marina TaxID=490629 RepID=A0A1I0W7C2_9PSEU|nr:type I restriction endonuclease subunit R [Amycolatopsis marina]SFA84217.1 type I restriction enzyme, R subunit [Amycolatopsis marina]
MSGGFSEAALEEHALESLGELAWYVAEGKKIAPGSGERDSWDDLVLYGRLREAVARLNPLLPDSAVDEAVSIVTTPTSRDAKAENRQVHEYLTKGIRKVVYTDAFGVEQNPTIRLLGRDPADNDWLAVNQVTATDGEHKRRFDLVLYVNGMPLAMFELKNASNPYTDLAGAHAQIMTYVEELPMAFRYNMACVVSDGITARYGTAFSPFEQYLPWNVDDEGKPVKQPGQDYTELPLNLVTYGLFNQQRMLDLLVGYVAFADDENGVVKRIARPHQYFAVTKAVGKTVEAVRGHGLAGVVWHTQGSGKSIEMELYTNQVLKHPALGNPTIVVITDRADLDDQLYSTFATSGLLTAEPVQMYSREQLRTELSNRTIGGIYFTTLQKFGRSKQEREAGRDHPLLSERHNIIVIVDEAHRSHYDDLDGYARHLRDALPNATMIAFTGTPISGVKDTRKVFGDYIDIYDLSRAVDDGATVPVYYQSRLIQVNLPDDLDPEIIDERADQATAGLDDAERERIQQTVAAMNALYGAPDRLEKLARDLVEHWEERSQQMRKFIGGPGKGMIVGATREICANLYAQIKELRPEWHHDDLDKGKIKVVYTGDASEKNAVIKTHIRRPSANKAIQQRMRDADDDLELVIVQSMWLTGFDAPPLHTMYLDKPMRGAALMQALARVNRTFHSKDAGLLVGYAPLTENLYAALAEYTATDQETKPLGRELDEAIAQARELYETIDKTILARYDWKAELASGHPKAFINAVSGAVNYLRDPENPDNQVGPEELSAGERFRQASAKLSRFYALCSSSGEMNDYRDGIAFFEAVRVWMAKWDAEERAASGQPIPADVALYLRQLTAGAIEAGGVTDLYEAAGIPRPNLAHLDEAFIERMQQSRNPHLAIEALRQLIEQEMRKVTKHNVVRQQSFTDRLIELMRKYTNQNLTAAEVIAEMVAMAREVSADSRRGEQFTPTLSPNELAFYDAVAQDETAVNVMGTGKLADIARDLVKSLQRNVTTDWVSRDDVRAKLRSTIKRLLAIHGYPPDAEPEATQLVLNQMETFAEEWSPAKGH